MPKTTHRIEFLYGPWDGVSVEVNLRSLPRDIEPAFFDKHCPSRINDNVPLVRSNWLKRRPQYSRGFTQSGVEHYIFCRYG